MNAYTESDSVYIPAVGNMTEQQIVEIFWRGYLGDVRRVDFIDTANGGKGAFVHFDRWYDNGTVTGVWYKIQTYGSCKHWFNKTEYLILRKMTTEPIPDTTMNIHQVAALLTEHTAKIAELEARVSEQDAIIEDFHQRQFREVEMGRLARRADWRMDDFQDMEIMVDSLLGPREPTDDEDTNMACVYAEDNISDDGSFGSQQSHNKRLRMSMDLCGNN
jgi:hypothetical protein